MQAKNGALSSSDCNETHTMNFGIPTSVENLTEIGEVVAEISPKEIKSQGRVYLGRRIYSAKSGTVFH